MRKLILLSGEKCPPCIRTKILFKQNNVVFTNIDVHLQKTLAQPYLNVSGTKNIPQLFIEDNGEIEFIFSGVSPIKLQNLILEFKL